MSSECCVCGLLCELPSGLPRRWHSRPRAAGPLPLAVSIRSPLVWDESGPRAGQLHGPCALPMRHRPSTGSKTVLSNCPCAEIRGPGCRTQRCPATYLQKDNIQCDLYNAHVLVHHRPKKFSEEFSVKRSPLTTLEIFSTTLRPGSEDVKSGFS